jgi:hypothetical protein
MKTKLKNLTNNIQEDIFKSSTKCNESLEEYINKLCKLSSANTLAFIYYQIINKDYTMKDLKLLIHKTLEADKEFKDYVYEIMKDLN